MGASLDLALLEARALAEDKRAREEARRTLLRQLVLVVDDVAEVRDLYQIALRFAGFQVEEACDGIEALEKAIALKPDGIVLDFAMPRMDGGEAVRRLSADPRTRAIPILMVSAYADRVPEDVRRGCAAFVEKPCSPDDLFGAIHRLIPPVYVVP
jgi:CheY-like chemotaxis protein